MVVADLNICWRTLDRRLLGFGRGTTAKTAEKMQDMKAQLEKLRTDAAECALIRDLATDPQKRALFTRLAEHLGSLASEVEAAMAAKLSGGGGA